MCYIITMTMWVKLAILDSLPFIVIYLVSGNLFFIWCLFLINSFNMGKYGVKITVISFVIAELLWACQKKSDSFILGFVQVLAFWWLFLLNVLYCVLKPDHHCLGYVVISIYHKWEIKSAEGPASGMVKEKNSKRREVTLRHSATAERGEPQWVYIATKTPGLFPVVLFFFFTFFFMDMVLDKVYYFYSCKCSKL